MLVDDEAINKVATILRASDFFRETNASLQLLPKAGLGKDKAQYLAVCFLILPIENPVTRR